MTDYSNEPTFRAGLLHLDRLQFIRNPAFWLLLFLLFQFVCSSPIHAVTFVRVGIYQNPPLVFIDNEDNVRGFYIDILEAIAAKEGWRLTYVPGTWDQCLKRLENGRIDLLVAVNYSTEQDELLDFSNETVLSNWVQVYTRKGAHIQSILDLEGKTVAMPRGDAFTERFRDMATGFDVDCNFLEANTFPEVFSLVETGKADAGVVNRLYGQMHEARYQIARSAILCCPTEIRFAVLKSHNQDLIQAIDRHIAAMKDDPGSVYYHAMDRWLTSPSPVIGMPTWALWLLISLMGLAVLLIIGSFVLRAQIRARTRELKAEIAERKQTEEALRESEERFRAIFESADDPIFVKDRSLKYILINPAMGKLFGVSPSQLIGSSDAELFGKEAAATLNAADSQVLEGEKVAEEHTLPVRGTQRTLHTVKVPMRDSSGAIVGLLGIARDVTSRVQTEAALRESEARLRAIFEAAEDIIFVKDRDLKFTFVNPAMKKFFGISASQIIGHTSEEVFGEEVGKHVREIETQILQGKTITISQEVILSARQEKRTLHITRVPMRDSSNTIIGVMGIARDITKRVQAEEERRMLEKQMQHVQKLESLGILAGGIAHDFNNLLVAILGNADLAMLKLSPDSPARELIQEIINAAQRAAELTRQMLAYSGRGMFVIETLNLSEVVREMTHMLEVSISKKATLKYDFADNLPSIEADVAQIRQVIMNLITNASESLGEESGVISISTGSMKCDRNYLNETYLTEDLPEGTYVYVEVADTGCGMDKETQEKIFDPFFTTKFTGRGLGLAAVLGIIRGHKGTIKVYSEVGKGTTFKVLFPASEKMSPAHEVSEDDTIDEWSGSGTVLFVEDEESVREIGKRMIETFGFTVLTAVDGYEAIELFRAHAGEIVCVLLDLTMPRMGGEETFREIRRIDPHVPVIMTSGYNEIEVTQRFIGKKLAGFVQKPFQLAELGTKLREAVESAGERAKE